jgi:glycosyltransferase A (GT-A) superfamily protein (DUF2064 family)
MQYPQGRILIFAKAPVPGYAKTRLIPALGEQGAADLHAKLIRKTVDMAVESRLAPVQLWICGPEGQTVFDEYHSAVNDGIHIQSGKDLGARMDNALTQTLQVADFAVLIGTDCPAMGCDYLESACVALATGCDTVLARISHRGSSRGCRGGCRCRAHAVQDGAGVADTTSSRLQRVRTADAGSSAAAVDPR